jgi:hypothetical protein
MEKTDDQIKQWVEGQYAKPDPWGYQRNPDDMRLKAWRV